MDLISALEKLNKASCTKFPVIPRRIKTSKEIWLDACIRHYLLVELSFEKHMTSVVVWALIVLDNPPSLWLIFAEWSLSILYRWMLGYEFGNKEYPQAEPRSVYVQYLHRVQKSVRSLDINSPYWDPRFRATRLNVRLFQMPDLNWQSAKIEVHIRNDPCRHKNKQRSTCPCYCLNDVTIRC